jgi:hypothetical protein
VVAIRSYLNVAEAELAKSLLDDYGILCEVAHENAHLYGGSPFAMPIQLRVEESRADQAIRILDGKTEAATDTETPGPARLALSDPEIAGRLARDNPWELLAIAALFLLPGIYVLQIKYPDMMALTRRARYFVFRLSVLHFFGWLAVVVAVTLIALYIRAVRSSGVQPPREFDVLGDADRRD